MPAQAAVPDPVIAQIEPLLRAEDPTVRGEAALAVASSGDRRFYQPLLQMAADKAPAARHRALLALGHLQHAGTDSVLDQTLREAPRGSLDRSLAAMALGILPAEPRTPAIDEFFVRVHSSSQKRIHDEFSSMLLGMLHHPQAPYRKSLESFLEDASYRDRPILALVIRNLASLTPGIDTALLFTLMDSSNLAIQGASLRAMRNPQSDLTQDQREVIRKLARNQRADPELRADALSLMTHRRQPESLKLAGEFLQGKAPALAAAAIRTTLKLGGGTLRTDLERFILDTADAAMQTAMLEAKSPPHSKAFVRGCFKVAIDKSASHHQRTPAALICAAGGEKRIRPIITSLFLQASHTESMATLARALRQLKVDIRDKVYPPRNFEDTVRLPKRLRALLSAGHPQSASLLTEVLAAKTTTPEQRALVLRAFRTSQLPSIPQSSLQIAPQGVRDLLE